MKSLDNPAHMWLNNYMTSTRSPFARSNAKQHFEITARGMTFTETQHGGGFGAHVKMMDRINERLFGTTNVSLTKVDEGPDGSEAVTLIERTTDRQLVVIFRKVQKL